MLRSVNMPAIKLITLLTLSIGNGTTWSQVNDVVINEIQVSTTGTDFEFVEFYGAAGSSLDGLALIGIESDSGNMGVIDRVISLDGLALNASGRLLAISPQGTAIYGISGDLEIPNNSFENGSAAYFLVSGFSAAAGDDLDTDDDGVLDITPWTRVVDSLSILDGGASDANYGSIALGPDGSFLPAGVFRSPDGGSFSDTFLNFDTPDGTPGQANTSSGDTGNEAELHLISEIQGDPSSYGSNNFGETDVSPLIGQAVTIEGIVVGDFQTGDSDTTRDLGGFYVQEETTDDDGNPLSSEALFVYDNRFGVNVALGDKVQLSGTVTQYFGETQLSDLSNVTIIDSGLLNSVTAAEIHLEDITNTTQSQDGRFQPDLEAYEGMLVRFPETLTINEQFQLDRFNEIRLVAGTRPFQFSQQHTPDAEGYEQSLKTLGARSIIYDDGLNTQNASIDNLDGFAPYDTGTAPRMGDSVSGLTGVLDYKWAGNAASGASWRVRSHLDGSNQFTRDAQGNSANPRPASPPALAGNLKIASFNVLNFFSTLDNGSNTTALGLEPRGADDLTAFGVTPADFEFQRQQQKLVTSLLAMDADVLGIIEVENDFDAVHDDSTAIERLVSALNNAAGGAVYDYVYPGQHFVGTDAIAVAVIYKPASVSLTAGTSVALLDDQVAATLPEFAGRDFAADPIFDGLATNRVSLAVSFTHVATGESFILDVNHFKSKGSSGLTDNSDPNFDQADGAGYFNQRRLDAAKAVNSWLATHPTGNRSENTVIVGDLNAYAMEAPVQFLVTQGYADIAQQWLGQDAYSYVFDGQLGTLDYVLLSNSLVDKVRDVNEWHINADEADALDYNADFGRSHSLFDGTLPWRTSDHDPVIVSLELTPISHSISDLITQYQTALANGSLKGVGRTDAARRAKQNSITNLLRTAVALDNKGKKAAACTLLNRIANFVDGQPNPVDRVAGEGRQAFYSNTLGVQQSVCRN